MFERFGEKDWLLKNNCFFGQKLFFGIVGELAEGGSVAVAVGVVDR